MVKFVGNVYKVDKFGRVTIPEKVRKMLNIKTGDFLDVYFTEDGALYRKHYLDKVKLGKVQ